MDAQRVDFTRDDLAKFIPDPRTIRAFENINLNQDAIIQSVSDIQASPLISVTLSPVFSNDRALSGSSDILLTDGGPKSSITVSLGPTGVSASTYGSASHTVAFAVDAKGRLTLAAQYALVTTNIAEGVNLYFTTARARQSLSGGAGISYSNVAGTIALDAAYITSGTYSPTATPGSNVSAVISYPAQYLKIGNVVTVSSRLRATFTSAGADSIVDISLPIASDFANAYECAGMAASADSSSSAMPFLADATGNTARLRGLAFATGTHDFYYTFTYQVI